MVLISWFRNRQGLKNPEKKNVPFLNSPQIMMGKGCLPLSCRNSPLFENSEEAIQCRQDKRGQGSKETPDVQTRPP